MRPNPRVISMKLLRASSPTLVCEQEKSGTTIRNFSGSRRDERSLLIQINPVCMQRPGGERSRSLRPTWVKQTEIYVFICVQTKYEREESRENRMKKAPVGRRDDKNTQKFFFSLRGHARSKPTRLVLGRGSRCLRHVFKTLRSNSGCCEDSTCSCLRCVSWVTGSVSC